MQHNTKAQASGRSTDGTLSEKPMGGGDHGAPLPSMPVTNHGKEFANHKGAQPDQDPEPGYGNR